MKNLVVILSICISTNSFAQEDLFANEGSGTFQSNPASFGNQERWSINTFGQYSFTEYFGAPGSFNINAGGLIPLAKSEKHNLIVGGTYLNRQSYYINDQTSRISIGYRLKWNKNTSASIAFGPGMSDLQYNQFIPMMSPYGDEIYFTEDNHGRKFDLSIGGMFNWKTLYAGLSVTHVNRPFVGVIPREFAPTYNLQAGYKIPVGGHSIFPTAQLIYVNGFSQYLVMTNYVFKNDLFSVGAGYQSGGDLVLGGSVELKGVRLGYNYNTLRVRGLGNSTGTHELRLSYIVRSKKEK